MGATQKEIKAYCPNCYASPDKIVYQNSGPIVRIYCSQCGIVYNESNAKKDGFFGYHRFPEQYRYLYATIIGLIIRRCLYGWHV